MFASCSNNEIDIKYEPLPSEYVDASHADKSIPTNAVDVNDARYAMYKPPAACQVVVKEEPMEIPVIDETLHPIEEVFCGSQNVKPEPCPALPPSEVDPLQASKSGSSKRSFEPEILIELVRQRECLYIGKLPAGRNRAKKEKAWLEIAKAMHMSPHACEGKWKNIRDTYIRNQNLEKTDFLSCMGKKRKRWYLMDSLSFLPRHDAQDSPDKDLNMERSVVVECVPDLPLEDVDSAKKADEGDDKASSNESDVDDSSCAPVVPMPAKRSRFRGRGRPANGRGGISSGSSRDSSVDSPTSEASKLVRKPSILLEALNRPKTQVYSENEHFCLSLVGSIDRMTFQQQIEFKLAVCELIAKTVVD